MSGTIEIRKISIVDLDTDAIVNAANEALVAGGGVCGAIFKAAGYQELQAACHVFGHCDVGDAVITPGFKLKAKYVIHAVGPRYRDGNHGEPERLKRAYQRALELAVENNCHSIGFPLISAGIFGYPVGSAWNEALRACKKFLDGMRKYHIRIVFAVLDDQILAEGKKQLLQSGASIYKIAEKDDWETCEMPEQHDTFVLERHFTEQQMSYLRRGSIPQEMEDKWFRDMEGDTLYIHRSWTGFCIYIVEFRPNDRHLVTVNRNPEQYKCTRIDEDRASLNKMLNWWSMAELDHYHEWLSETADMIKKDREKQMKILILNGSPRLNGNTKQMVNAFCEGLNEAGHEYTIFDVCRMNVHGCLACEYCHTKGEGACIQKDDMQKIYPVLQEADMLVIASPIYYHGLSGQLKCVIDRFYAAAYPNKPPKLKKAAMFLSSGDPDMYDGALFSYRGDFLDYLGLEDMGVFTTQGYDPGVAKEKLEEIRRFGAELKGK